MTGRKKDEIVGVIGGDAFGNGGKKIWRCRRCEGLYITRPTPFDPVVVGTVLIDPESPLAQKRAQEHLRRMADLYSSQPHCGCEDRIERTEWNPPVPLTSFWSLELPDRDSSEPSGSLVNDDEKDENL